MNNTKKLGSRTGTSTLVRARFGPGMLLQHEDLEQLNSYTRELSRLMFQSLFGCGVICGLVVSVPEPSCGKVKVTVGAGVALGCSGDPIYVPRDESFAIDEDCDSDIDGPLWVVLCGTVKCCAPRTAICSPEDEDPHAECTRERDGYEIRVMSKRPECVCGCDPPARPEASLLVGSPAERENKCKCVDPELPCYADHYAGKCGCNCNECSDSNCQCILLARLDKRDDAKNPWTVDHKVRRFVRPVLMGDPLTAPAPKAVPASINSAMTGVSIEPSQKNDPAPPVGHALTTVQPDPVKTETVETEPAQTEPALQAAASEKGDKALNSTRETSAPLKAKPRATKSSKASKSV